MVGPAVPATVASRNAAVPCRAMPCLMACLQMSLPTFKQSLSFARLAVVQQQCMMAPPRSARGSPFACASIRTSISACPQITVHHPAELAVPRPAVLHASQYIHYGAVSCLLAQQWYYYWEAQPSYFIHQCSAVSSPAVQRRPTRFRPFSRSRVQACAQRSSRRVDCNDPCLYNI
jgi:hypothetical protein